MTLATAQLVITITVVTVVAVRCWPRRHRVLPLRVLAVNCTIVAVWSAAELVAVLAPNARTAYVAKLASSPLLIVLCGGLLVLSLAVLDRGWEPSRRLLAALALVPAAAGVAALTDPWHGLVFRAVHWHGSGHEATVEPGPAFWVNVVYGQSLVVISMVRVAQAWHRSRDSHRRMLGALLVGSLVPVLARVVGYAGALPFDATAAGFMVLAVAGYVAVSRNWIERMPLAHQRVLESVSDAVLVVDANGVIVDANNAARRLSRHLRPREGVELIGGTVDGLLMGLAPPDHGSAEHTLTDVWGSGLDLHVRVQAIADRRRGAIGWTFVARDITELNRRRREVDQANAQLARANAQLRAQLATIEALRADLAEQAVRDPLTGLHNRRHLMERIDQLVLDAGPAGPQMSLAIIDVDHFKRVNDEYGHGAGDAVLVQLSRVFAADLGVDDLLARHGGEEFVVLMPGTPAEAALRRMEGLRRRVAASAVDAEGRFLQVTVSVGVASAAGQVPRARLFQAADAALYRAKGAGRNRVVAAPEPLTAA
ncbi:MAG TPA: diguanylate cyclase [Pilimelia sp.]|nr:diguanylate cyclase [Pilimelia sp.]